MCWFETLTYFLDRPKPLELTASDEIIAQDNLEILRQNGFEIDTEGADESGDERSRLRLVAQPVSKGTVFDLKGESIPRESTRCELTENPRPGGVTESSTGQPPRSDGTL